MENDFLKNLDGGQVREIVDSMYPREFERGSFVIREGDAGIQNYNEMKSLWIGISFFFIL